jgi:hypothetical protein
LRDTKQVRILTPRPTKASLAEVWLDFNQSTFGGFLFHRSAL